jgi:hypothetical protein
MTNFPDRRVGRKSLSGGRFILLLLLAAIVVVAVARILDWLGNVAAMVVIICAAVAVAAVAWFDER